MNTCIYIYIYCKLIFRIRLTDRVYCCYWIWDMDFWFSFSRVCLLSPEFSITLGMFFYTLSARGLPNFRVNMIFIVKFYIEIVWPRPPYHHRLFCSIVTAILNYTVYHFDKISYLIIYVMVTFIIICTCSSCYIFFIFRCLRTSMHCNLQFYLLKLLLFPLKKGYIWSFFIKDSNNFWSDN